MSKQSKRHMGADIKSAEGVDAITVDAAGNVGIGTDSPARKLHVDASGPVYTTIRNSTNNVHTTIGVTTTDGWVGTESNHPLVMYTNATERARIDASGRVGIGTTSFGGGSPAGSISIPAGASIQSASFGRVWVPQNQIGSTSYAGLYGLATTYNAYYSDGWKSCGGGTASAITIDEGNFSFSNSNSVSGPDLPLTWNTRMSIDSSGNVGIGTESPSSLGGSITTVELKGKLPNRGGGIRMSSSDSSLDGALYAADGIIHMGALTSHSVEFVTQNVPRMRIEANGNCILGGNTASGYSKLRGGANTPAFAWRNNINASYSTFIVQRSEAAAGSQIYQIFEAGATDIGVGGSTVGGIRRNSGNTAFEFFNSSDERLKNVKGEFSAALEKVEGIPVKWFSWKTSPDQEHFRFIAQDVQKHIPSAVFEDEEGHLQLGESDMFPILWQAVRELKAELDEAKAEGAALRAELEALKVK